MIMRSLLKCIQQPDYYRTSLLFYVSTLGPLIRYNRNNLQVVHDNNHTWLNNAQVYCNWTPSQ